MNRLTLFLFLLFFSNSTFSQKNQQVFKQFGKIDASEFNPTDFDDLGYEALILTDEKRVYFDTYNESLRLYNVFHRRIKVLQDGFSDKNLFTLNYSGRYDYEKVIFWKISVFTLNGNKIEQFKLKSKFAKHIDSDSLESKIEFDLPLLKKGDIIDFEYYLVTFDFMLPPAFEFKYKYPCLNSEFVASFPEHMKYKFDIQDFTNNISHSSSEGFQSISYLYSPQDNPNSLFYMQGRARRFVLNYKFHTQVDTFKSSYILPFQIGDSDENYLGCLKVVMKASKFTQNIGYSHPIYVNGWKQMTHLLYTYADPDNRYITQSEAWFKLYNAGYVIVNSESWSLLHKRLRKSPYFWKPLMKSFDLPEALQKIIDDSEFTDSLMTVSRIYNYVISSVSWDSTFTNHVNKNPEKTLKTKIGSSADINMVFISLLRRAGFNAFPALSATRDFGRIDTSYANIIQFNNVLAVIRLSDNYCVVIDCSQQNHPYNRLPINDLNNFCWAVAPEEGFFIEYDNNLFQ